MVSGDRSGIADDGMLRGRMVALRGTVKRRGRQVLLTEEVKVYEEGTMAVEEGRAGRGY